MLAIGDVEGKFVAQFLAQGQGETLAGQVVVQTTQHQGAAQRVRRDLLAAQPVGAQYVRVQGLPRIVALYLAAEADAQKGLPLGVAPAIEAGNGLGLEVPGGLFPHLTDYGSREAFPVFQVARRLVKNAEAVGGLFDDQEAAGLFDHGGHGDAGCPSHGRALYAIRPVFAPRPIGPGPDRPGSRGRF